MFQSFPNLTSLALDRRESKNFTGDDIKTIVSLNPQLQSLSLGGCHDMSIWETVNYNLTKLKSIYVFFASVNPNFKGAPILFECVEECFMRLNLADHKAFKPNDLFAFKCLKKLTIHCYASELEGWFDFNIARPTIDELTICLSEIWPTNIIKLYRTNQLHFNQSFEEFLKKLNKIKENTKFISTQTRKGSSMQKPTKRILIFIESYPWFDKFSLEFDYDYLHLSKLRMEEFDEVIPHIKNYKMKKNTIYGNMSVELEKFE